MSIFSIPLDQISEQTLTALIENSVEESMVLDFKRTGYGPSDSDKKELLADASSFANTRGGDIILGIDAPLGVATKILGLDSNTDEDILRMESIITHGLEPRLQGVKFHKVQMNGGKCCIVIRIPKSLAPPHRVIFKGSNRFWARQTKGKFEPDTNQLRLLFAQFPSLNQRVVETHLERIARLHVGDAPKELLATDMVVVHVVPAIALDDATSIPVTTLASRGAQLRPPGTSSGFDFAVNLEGFITYTVGPDGKVPAYATIWRNGFLEFVRTKIVRESKSRKVVWSSVQEKHVIESLQSAFSVCADLSIEGPFIVLVSLIGVRGAAWISSENSDYSKTFDRAIISRRQVVIEKRLENKEIAPALIPLFNEIANAAGLYKSPNVTHGNVWREP